MPNINEQYISQSCHSQVFIRSWI